jgi:hypothetical protein
MPGGLHVRLVAPLEFRVKATAELLGLTNAAAADWVREKDASRDAFYRRHWPRRPLVPENFSIVLNTAALSIPQQVGAIVAVLSGVPDSEVAATMK